jgi:ribosome-associated toxin RatA of RatAB toxin-antitoxin module
MWTTIGIDIAAPPDLVFRLARDVTRWERLLPHYARSRAVGRDPDGTLVCTFVARRPVIGILGLGVPVTWRSRTWSEPETRRLRFVHVAGATRGMDVTWTIEPSPTGTRVDIGHELRRRIAIPVVGSFVGEVLFPELVDRVFTRAIAGRTLATFKALAEALAADVAEPSAPDRSVRRPATNP